MANEIQGTLTRKFVLGGQTIGGSAVTVLGNASIIVSMTLLATTANQEIDVAFDPATVVVLSMMSTTPCTVKTNSSGAPVDTFDLAANTPKEWADTDDPDPIFITAAVTKLFVTTAGAGGVLQVLALLDATP